ncbi:hypothetical protein, partial [Amycolatopsis alba]|uniref:hypothetical protein n=1 Tax=Amycolatopsis alba TaxID=76020 RepID=UPI00201245E8
TRTAPATSPIPALETGRRRLTVGGQLRLARSEALPIRTGFDADPICSARRSGSAAAHWAASLRPNSARCATGSVPSRSPSPPT